MREESDKIRIAFGKAFTACCQPAPLIKKRRAPVAQLLSAISCGLWEGDVCAVLLVADVKTAAVLDLQKLSCPPH
jgi:hypothetical protein